jgi:DNA-binding transcriptional ArsR family regulator
MPSATSTDELDGDEVLDRVFRALGDPTRRSIITQLTQGEATISEIASQFDMSLPGVSKHVSVLEEAGLVDRWRSGRTRRCTLRVERLRAADAWIREGTEFWDKTLEALAAYIEADDA